MAHPAVTTQVSPQQILNAGYNFSVSAFNTYAGYGYTNVATSAQNVVKTGSGVLGRIAVNSTLTSAVRGYDNTVSGGNVLFTIPASTAASVFAYDVRFTNGLVVSTGAAADNITVMYN